MKNEKTPETDFGINKWGLKALVNADISVFNCTTVYIIRRKLK